MPPYVDISDRSPGDSNSAPVAAILLPEEFAVTLARSYLRQTALSVGLVIVLAAGATGWWLLHNVSTTFSRTVRSAREGLPLTSSIDSLSARIRAMAKEAAVADDLEQWKREAEIARKKIDLSTLKSITERMTRLANKLSNAYEIHITGDLDQRYGFTRDFEDKNGKRPAYYVIVSATDGQGQPIRRTILNAETNQSSTVDRWAEQVPKEVYDRLIADKKTNGTLDETLFAVKQKGFRNEEVRIEGSDGKPLSRLGQITEW